MNNTDINTNDLARQTYLSLKGTYDLFNVNSVDPYDKLIGKNNSVNDIYLDDLVHGIHQFELQNCNFAENTVPKLYEDKSFSNNKSHSMRRLNALSPNNDLPEYNNDDIHNDLFQENDIKYDLPEMKYRNMDISYLQYMSNRGPDNTTNGFIDWADVPKFHEEKYKKYDKRKLLNDIVFHQTDSLNGDFDITAKHKTSTNQQKTDDTNKKVYNNFKINDIEFYNSNDGYVYTSSNKYNHYNGLNGILNKTIVNLPTEKQLRYRNLKNQSIPERAYNPHTGAEINLPKSKEYRSFINYSSLPIPDTEIRNYVKKALLEINHNNLNESSINKNNKNNITKELFTLNLNQDENLKYGLKDSQTYTFNNKNTLYGNIKNAVAEYLKNYDSDTRHRKQDNISYDRFNNNSHLYNLSNPYNNQINNIKNSDKLYSIIRDEYSNLKDSNDMLHDKYKNNHKMTYKLTF
jgi:hypothetical protein